MRRELNIQLIAMSNYERDRNKLYQHLMTPTNAKKTGEIFRVVFTGVNF